MGTISQETVRIGSVWRDSEGTTYVVRSTGEAGARLHPRDGGDEFTASWRFLAMCREIEIECSVEAVRAGSSVYGDKVCVFWDVVADGQFVECYLADSADEAIAMALVEGVL